MDFLEVVLQSMEAVLEMERDELSDDVDLIEDEILDSLSIVMLLDDISTRIGCEININKLSPEDFTSVTKLANAVEAQCS